LQLGIKVYQINEYFTIREKGPQDTENKFKKINIDKLGMCNTKVSDKKPGHALCFS